MNAERFIQVVKIIKEYAEKYSGKLNLDTFKNYIDHTKIQLHSFSGENEYKYITDTSSKLAYLQYLLHGAIKKCSSDDYEDGVRNYIIHELKLLWGMYFFIDPREAKSANSKSHYVVGAVKTDDPLIPSFTFPHYSNLKNFRRNAEFHLLPDNWQAFYTKVLTLARGNIDFKNDFVKYFNEVEGDDLGKQRSSIENDNNFLYVSSGEIDHIILQWLFCSLNGLKPIDVIEKQEFPICLNEIDPDNILKNVFDNREDEVVKKISFDCPGHGVLLGNVNSQSLKLSWYGWLEQFGLLDAGYPTERLIAAIEFFYLHLKNNLDDNQSKHYFSLDNEKFYNNGNICANEFLEKCEFLLPINGTNYIELIKGMKEKDYESKKQMLLTSYFNLLACYANMKKDFRKYARIQPLSPFFQRNVPSLYNSLLKEHTCRAFVVIPVFSNPDGIDPNNPYLKNLGYFLGIIKDSDSKGRCFFNWSKHSDTKTSSSSITKFYSNDLFYLQNFVYTLGQNEVKQIYYKGIAERNKHEIQTHALQSAVAQVFARNFAHNIGSHVAIRATNRMAKDRIAELYRIEKIKFKDNTDIESWLDYMGEKLDLFEVARNEFLAEYKLPAKNAMLYRDVILPFCENTLLMDNIAHSESVHYKYHCCNKLKIKVLINGKDIKANYPNLLSFYGYSEISYPDNFPYLVKAKDGSINIDEAFNKREIVDKNGNIVSDIEICLPNEHTIYSILENLIRNSAKHNKDRIKEELEITIEITDESDDYYSIKIYDNVSAVNAEKIIGFSEKIAKPLISTDGEIQKENLGIADIKINAHLLKTDADITNDNLKSAINLIFRKEYDETKPLNKEQNGMASEYFNPLTEQLDAFTVYSSTDKEKPTSEKNIYNFGYQFKLCKPKKVVWIGIDNKAKKDELKKKGIILFKDKAEFESKPKDDEVSPLANYQFAILELDAVSKLSNGSPNYEWDDFLIKLPHRVLLNVPSIDKVLYPKIDKLIENGRIQCVAPIIPLPKTNDYGKNIEDWDFTFLKTCWGNWLRKWYISNDNKGNLMIYLEDVNMRKNWDDISTDFLNVYSSSNTPPPSSDILIEKDKTTVIYDHHSAGKGMLKSGDTDTHFKGDFIKRDAYFCYDKGSSDYVLLAFPSQKKEDKILFAYEAFEAGMKKIVIADERIADKIPFTDSNIEHISSAMDFPKSKAQADVVKPNLSDLANNGNLFIVNRINENIEISKHENCHLTIPNTETEKAFLTFIGIKNYDKNELNIDALVIHRTYLQQLFEKRSATQSKKDLMNQLYQKFKRVVVVSGGGKPHSMKVPMNFKPYSQLANTLVKYPSKINLNKIL